MVSSSVARGLEDAGLKRFVPAFSGVSDQAFLGLMMSDYASYGVVELEDKQRLFRLIKSIAASVKSSDAPAPALEKPNALIDLDENDGDLLADVSGVQLRARVHPNCLPARSCCMSTSSQTCRPASTFSCRPSRTRTQRRPCHPGVGACHHPKERTRPKSVSSCASAPSAKRWVGTR